MVLKGWPTRAMVIMIMMMMAVMVVMAVAIQSPL